MNTEYSGPPKCYVFSEAAMGSGHSLIKGLFIISFIVETSATLVTSAPR